MKIVDTAHAPRAIGPHSQAVIHAIVFLNDLNDFAAMNAIYEPSLGKHAAARSTIEVARLPLDVRVEIECIAAVS